MLTWFDALLVTIWAAVTVLGLRRGLGGAVWGAAALLAMLLVNFIAAPIVAAVFALSLGFAAAVLAERVLWIAAPRPWHLALGAVGGAALGFVVIAAFALAFPMRVLGSQATYPSPDLPAFVYGGIVNSLVQRSLIGVFDGPGPVRHLLVPDRNRSSRGPR